MSPGSGAVEAYVTAGGQPKAMATGSRSPRRCGDLVVVAAVLVDLPVHADGAPVVPLEPVEAQVADAGLRVLGVGQAQVEERAAVLRAR